MDYLKNNNAPVTGEPAGNESAGSEQQGLYQVTGDETLPGMVANCNEAGLLDFLLLGVDPASHTYAAIVASLGAPPFAGSCEVKLIAPLRIRDLPSADLTVLYPERGRA